MRRIHNPITCIKSMVKVLRESGKEDSQSYNMNYEPGKGIERAR